MNAYAAAAKEHKAYEAALFGSQSPPPILLSDADVEALARLEAEERETERVVKEKLAAYEAAKRGH